MFFFRKEYANEEDVATVERHLTSAVHLLKSLSNVRRLTVICILHNEGEKTVGELEKIVGLSQSALSQHLARLRKDGLVSTRRDAQAIYYKISDTAADKMLECLHDIFCEKDR